MEIPLQEPGARAHIFLVVPDIFKRLSQQVADYAISVPCPTTGENLSVGCDDYASEQLCAYPREKGVLMLTLIAVAVLAPIAEEIFFRGFLYGGLRRRMGALGAMLTSTLLFTALHFSLDAFIPIFVLGLFLAWLYERTGSLYPGMLLHAANNGLALVLLAILQMAGVKLP